MNVCPKCRGLNISVKYEEDGTTGEWLKYCCWTCGYEGRERPKDYIEHNPYNEADFKQSFGARKIL